MLFNSIDFMVFFPVVLLVYFIIPKRLRYIWLLVVSYYFYMGWNAQYAMLIAVSTVITYLSGILLQFEIDRKNRKGIKKLIVTVSLISNLEILAFFKYFNFFYDNLNLVLSNFNIQLVENPFDIILPVGISFYTFQALGYTIDVYRQDIRAEKNPLRYALFVSFFPQLVAGPIERSKNLLTQMQNVHKIKIWSLKNIERGIILMVWGYFLKMVIADRVAILVDNVFDNYFMYGSVELILAAIGFALQIYCDFASYSTIAVGAASIMGFTLMENFNTPYFSRSIKEFWRRWHVSLSSWFRDYVYIPLGGSRCSRFRKYLNLACTFLLSGLWHGANWTFVIWGALHAVYQIIGDLTAPVKKWFCKILQINTECFSHKLLQTVTTFVLVDFAWIFFRADSISHAIEYMKQIVARPNIWALVDGSIYAAGLDRTEMGVLLFAVVIMLLVDFVRYHLDVKLDEFLMAQNAWFIGLCIIAAIVYIFIYGIYGPLYDAAQFIYFQF